MSRTEKIIYWVSTLWLALGMVSTGLLQLTFQYAEGALSPPGVYGMIHLGFPIYLLAFLGVCKILGTIALLVPKFPIVKEWAYAGFFFLLAGAWYAHIAVGDPFVELLPSLLLLVLLGLSWYYRPADRRSA